MSRVNENSLTRWLQKGVLGPNDREETQYIHTFITHNMSRHDCISSFVSVGLCLFLVISMCSAPTHLRIHFHTSQACARLKKPFLFHAGGVRESNTQVHDVKKTDDFVQAAQEAKD